MTGNAFQRIAKSKVHNHDLYIYMEQLIILYMDLNQKPWKFENSKMYIHQPKSEWHDRRFEFLPMHPIKQKVENNEVWQHTHNF